MIAAIAGTVAVLTGYAMSTGRGRDCPRDGRYVAGLLLRAAGAFPMGLGLINPLGRTHWLDGFPVLGRVAVVALVLGPVQYAILSLWRIPLHVKAGTLDLVWAGGKVIEDPVDDRSAWLWFAGAMAAVAGLIWIDLNTKLSATGIGIVLFGTLVVWSGGSRRGPIWQRALLRPLASIWRSEITPDQTAFRLRIIGLLIIAWGLWRVWTGL